MYWKRYVHYIQWRVNFEIPGPTVVSTTEILSRYLCGHKVRHKGLISGESLREDGWTVRMFFPLSLSYNYEIRDSKTLTNNVLSRGLPEPDWVYRCERMIIKNSWWHLTRTLPYRTLSRVDARQRQRGPSSYRNFETRHPTCQGPHVGRFRQKVPGSRPYVHRIRVHSETGGTQDPLLERNSGWTRTQQRTTDRHSLCRRNPLRNIDSRKAELSESV